MFAGVRRTIVDNDWGVLGVLLVFFVGAVFGSRAAHVDSGVVNWAAWLDSFLQNAGTEMLGAALTFGLIEMLRGARREREAEERATEERKARLIRQMGSRVNEEAMRAAEELVAAGWLEDGSLQGAYLRGANLRGAGLVRANLQGAYLREAALQGTTLRMADLQAADLSGADLQEADLFGANLQGASLENANLRKANLKEANLQGADLTWANLQEADLIEANLRRAVLEATELVKARLDAADLEGANLDGANLEGANLWEANLGGAKLKSALFDEDTILPDDSRATPVTDAEDMARFTDPDHSEFWRSDEPESPAYRGDD